MLRKARTPSHHLLAALLVGSILTGIPLLTGAPPATAEVHSFKALGSTHAVSRSFQVVGVDANAFIDALLISPRGDKGFPVAGVRHAYRPHRHAASSRKHPARSRKHTACPRKHTARSRKHPARCRKHVVIAAKQSGPQAQKFTTAPETTITGGPEEGSQTTSTAAEFLFSSTAARATFYCSLDGSSPQGCSSGVVYGGLAQGTHRFTVYAVDRYGVRDPSPAARSWSIVSSPPSTSPPDTTAPDTSITSGPVDGSSTSTSVSFSFSGADNVGVTGYECSLDAAPFSACSSPEAYSGLSAGTHTFSVHALDAAGNVDPTPAIRTWTVTLSGSVYTVPSSVPSGCSTDATSEISSWIASVPNDSTISFGLGACYRIEGTLELQNRTLTVDGNGATFRSFNAPEDQRAIWRLWNSNVTLRNMTDIGSYASGGVFNANLEHAHGIDLRGTHAVIENVAVRNVGGDCVYFGLGSDSTTRSSGSFHDSSCVGTGRNAVSVTAGNNILVQRVTLSTLGFDAFDVEPNIAAGNWGSQNVTFDSNIIGSYRLSAYSIVENAAISNQAFTNNIVKGRGLHIAVAPVSSVVARPQAVTIQGNSSDTAQTPAAMSLEDVDGLTVTGNAVPMTSGTMAVVNNSCGVDVSGNALLGALTEITITNPAC
jgi:hypothetical protein